MCAFVAYPHPGVWPAEPSCSPITCSAIAVTPSTTTAGAVCEGGVASGGPTCSFTCENGYQLTGSSEITCGSDGECGEGEVWLARGGLRGVSQVLVVQLQELGWMSGRLGAQ